jgi:hypothetical protein
MTKTLDATQNTADIRIHNLSDNTRSRIDENDLVLTFRAGYEENLGLELLFQGDITYIENDFVAPEIITKLQCGDGANVLKNQYINGSFREGTTVGDVVSFIGDELGIPVSYNNIDTREQFSQGYAISSDAKSALDLVTEKAGATWSIQDGELQLLVDNTSNPNEIVFLSSATGLLDSPKLTTQDSYKLEGPASEAPTVRLKSLLNAKIRPGGIIEVDSRERSGQYRVERVDHRGDNKSGPFESVVEAIQI